HFRSRFCEQSLVREFYRLLDKDGITANIHLFNEKLPEREDYYNYHRPQGPLGGQPLNTEWAAPCRSQFRVMGQFEIRLDSLQLAPFEYDHLFDEPAGSHGEPLAVGRYLIRD